MIWNVIDNRKRPFRWERIKAIAEPTWHDNNNTDADKAESSAGEVDYEERELLSVADAITWAHAFPFAVTLHLYDENDGIGTDEKRGS